MTLGTPASTDFMARAAPSFSPTKGTAGNGSGLWVCQEIVDRHHGKLFVRSIQFPGRNGATFTFFLPFQPGMLIAQHFRQICVHQRSGRDG